MEAGVAENTLLHIALTQWAPSIFTICVGGLLASVIFPRLQGRWQVDRTRHAKRVEIAERIAQQLDRYIVCWRRLMQISQLEASRALTAEEAERKRAFIAQRNERRDALHDSLTIGGLYFSDGAAELFAAYRAWDEGNAAKRLSDLPDIAEWRDWERRIVATVKRELAARR